MKHVFFFCMISFALMTQIVFGQIPQTISYQGVLTNADGTAVPDSVHSLTLKLYDVATGGTELWSETQSVAVADGIFNVIMGSINPLTLGFDQTYWLGVTIGQDPELTPRIELTASAYSLNARSIADGAVTGSSIADGQVVRSVNAITDDVTLAAGNNVTIDQNGDTLVISSSGGGGGGNTLDQAYDQGGAGAGRQIIADAGAVDITGSDGLTVNGNVGIGTTFPQDKLEVNGNVRIGSDTHIFGLGFDQGSKITTGRAGMVIQIDSDSNQTDGFDIQRGDGTSLLFVKSDGSVGIGTNDPREKLFVNGDLLIGADTYILGLEADQGSKITTGRAGMVVQIDRDNNFSLTDAFDVQRGDSTSILFVRSDGNVGIGTVSPGNILTVEQGSATDPIADAWTTYSSRRWKTNVQPIEGALEKVKRLRGVSYDEKESGKHNIGLIAEEVGEVIPEIVSYEENGKDAKSVDYARLVAVLIEAVKEQQIEIENNKAAIEALIVRLTALEGNSQLTNR